MSRNKRFTAFFLTDGATPATGLSPTITIYNRTDGTTAVTDGAMTEVGGGLYEYELETYDYTKDYLAVADGTATLTGSNRYVSMGNESYVNDIADKMNKDHGQGIWTKPASNLLDTKKEFTKKQLEEIIEKLTESLESREINIPYTFDTKDIEKAVQGYLKSIGDKAEKALVKIKNPQVKVTTQRVLVKQEKVQTDLAPVVSAIKESMKAMTSQLSGKFKDEEIKAEIKKGFSGFTKRFEDEIDAAVDELTELIFEEVKDEEKSKYYKNKNELLEERKEKRKKRNIS